MTFESQMPLKVRQLATDMGAHHDCLGAPDVCGRCELIVVAAFDHFYGAHPDEGAVLDAILDDLEFDANFERWFQ